MPKHTRVCITAQSEAQVGELRERGVDGGREESPKREERSPPQVALLYANETGVPKPSAPAIQDTHP